MQTLLVASQKGGVGKTTTSINLAAATAMTGTRVLLLDADPLSSISAYLGLGMHPRRQHLQQSGLDLPGVLTCNVLPCLDVLSPYDESGCSDERLDQLLGLLAQPAFRACYGCLVVNTQPFLGSNAPRLLATCDRYVLVMRAEPLAHRTFPAFQELLQRTRATAPIQLAGILLTLSEGEHPGGRWERELRGRFGGRTLPQTVPYDEAVGQEMLDGLIVSHARRDAPVAHVYHAVVEHLQLTAEKTAGPRPAALSVLKQLAAAGGLPAPAIAPAAPPVCPSRYLDARAQTPAAPVPAPETVPEVLRHRLTPAEPLPAAPRDRPRRSAQGGTARPTAPAPLATPVARPAAGLSAGAGLLFMAVGMMAGIALRFYPLSRAMVPYLVGLGVGAAVLLLLRPRGTTTAKPAAPASKPAAPPADRKEAAAQRLSGLTRQAQTSSRRQHRDN